MDNGQSYQPTVEKKIIDYNLFNIKNKKYIPVNLFSSFQVDSPCRTNTNWWILLIESREIPILLTLIKLTMESHRQNYKQDHER